MNLRCLFTLGVRRFSAGEPDSHGNAVPVFAPAVDWPVYGVAPGAMAEPGEANRNLSIVEFTVVAPADGPVPGESDLVVYAGAEYEVNGRPRDYSQGPFGFAAGVAVELRRTEG